MMEQDPESTQFTQTQRGKAKVRNGTRWGGRAALGVAKLLEAPFCASLVLVLFYSSVNSFETGGSGDWEVLQVSEQNLWWQRVVTELLCFGAHFCKWGT